MSHVRIQRKRCRYCKAVRPTYLIASHEAQCKQRS
jgi:hypothetical protein